VKEEIRVATLEAGDDFGLRLDTVRKTKRGKVLAISSGSVLVEWEVEPRDVTFHDAEGKEKTISLPRRRREHISLETLVIKIEGRGGVRKKLDATRERRKIRRSGSEGKAGARVGIGALRVTSKTGRDNA
jgi:hypothetical protein